MKPAIDIEVLTVFPAMIVEPLALSILGKAQEAGVCHIVATDIRDFALGKHRVTDDAPYGGGAGMVMKPEPLVAAIEAARVRKPAAPVYLLSPQGRTFDHGFAQELAKRSEFILVCGRYEGVDDRVRGFVDGEISLGDFVLSGGEFGALAIIDAVVRLVPGVLGNEISALTESFADGLLEYPQYTRPPDFRGLKVPEVLLSGNHRDVARWRATQSLERTRSRRPDLIRAAAVGKPCAAQPRPVQEVHRGET